MFSGHNIKGGSNKHFNHVDPTNVIVSSLYYINNRFIEQIHVLHFIILYILMEECASYRHIIGLSTISLGICVSGMIK